MSTIEQPTTTRISGFPSRKLDKARIELAAAHAKLTRAAAKAGQAAPVAPTLDVVGETWDSICTKCKITSEGVVGGTCLYCHEGVVLARRVLDLEITWARPALAGWEFLAVVEPMVGGNLIRRVPSAIVADGELDRWRTADLRCDHCATKRQRAETFVVRADGTAPAIPAGTYRQIGRTCLKAFLGGLSPAAIVASIGWADLVRQVANDGDDIGMGGFHVDPHHEIGEFMAWVASIARLDGFVTRAQARDRDTQSTADRVEHLLTPPWGGGSAVQRWQEARIKYAPTAADRMRGTAALAWACALTGASDYERNLKLVATQPAISPKHAGILASALQAYDRSVGDRVRAARAATTPSVHVGVVGTKLALGRVTVERLVVTETAYGPLHIHALRDATGNLLVWKTGKAAASVGESVELTGTIKAHTEFRGELQTELVRCKITRGASPQQPIEALSARS